MIDFDNVTMGIRSDLQNQLRKLLNSEIIKGKVAVQRAYADWRRYPQYIVPLSEASIDLIFAPAFGSNKKNATDIRLAIDALELVFTRPEIGTFILLSGDSDFSSLVLKLKEYGKYIIGVGIRESSSDLLIQNCDEYYSYTEVTGLTREGEAEGARRDAWELVVEAVSEMKRESDVMRSDRLKQVMQTIDPNFDEKDAGFSRFSKFVVEAGRRGLLSLEKMENGQYAIDVGANANVPPEEEEELRKAPPPDRESAAKTRRKRPRRKEPDVEQGGLTLAEAFDLLRRCLGEFAEAAESGAAAEDVYARMKERHGDADDPMFERPRFQRMLRQAHDAQVIELAKVDGTYRLKPGAAAEPKPPAEKVAPDAAPEGGEHEPSGSERGAKTVDGDETKEQKPARGRSRTSRKRTTKREKPDEHGDREPASGSGRTPSESKAGAAEERQPRAESAKEAESRADAAHKRNPRFRRGSRGQPGARGTGTAAQTAESAMPKKVDGEERAAAAPAPTAKPAASESGAHRTVRTRRGSRGRGRKGKTEAGNGGEQAPPAGKPAEQRAAAPAPKSEQPAAPVPKPEQRAAPAAPAPPAQGAPQQGSLFEGAPQEDGSLFRRMTAALQRVMRGPDSDE